ncbi:MAG: folylpolyglutamate synthase/dihydrofolate synthase family protein [Bacteroidota bacterium]
MPFDNFPDTLDYLYSLLPMYQRQGTSAFKKGLENTLDLCEALGNPQNSFQAIHVGGTNGKGSVSSMLTSVLMETGLKVGLYTSPHLVNFTERIRVNGLEMEKEGVIRFVNEHQSLIEKIQPSFFELTVAMAFHEFSRQAVDVAVVEVGLGGRLDSTNILTPTLSVITNISYDHQAMLGDTLGEIAGEKAGIIKQGIPVVIGETHPETQHVFVNKAEEQNSPIVFADNWYSILQSSTNGQGQEVHLLNGTVGTPHAYTLDLVGTYQQQNLRTALTGLDLLKELDWEIPKMAIQKGINTVINNTNIRGRMEKVSDSPLAYCDVGHNEAGVQAIFQQLSTMECEKLHIIWGMVSDKEHEKILALLPKEASYYWVKPDVPRGLDVHILLEKAEAAELSGTLTSDIKTAWDTAVTQAGKNDLIFIGGSTFVVADTLREVFSLELGVLGGTREKNHVPYVPHARNE